MESNLKILAEDLILKVKKSVSLVNSSLNSLEPFDLSKEYTDKESEPYDALSGRFIRAVEVCVKFFRVYERLIFGESSSTLRELLNKMEKINLISSVNLWIDMRDVRNRIVHDYLPDTIKYIYDCIMFEYNNELNKVINFDFKEL